MKNQKKQNIILICSSIEKEYIKNRLKEDFNVICKEKCNPVLFLLRTEQIAAIVCYINNDEQQIFDVHKKTTNTFPFIPKLAIIKDNNNLELIRMCGENGFNKIILYSESYELPIELQKLINKHSIKVTLEELGIVLNDDMPKLLKQALQYIEKEYINLKGIEEIIDYLDTSYKTLSCNLKQALLPSPKVILMFFKIRHSLYLLKENCLSNKEIAFKSGFTNEKRFAECMRRLFDKTPGECRNELISKPVETFWEEGVPFVTGEYELQKQE